MDMKDIFEQARNLQSKVTEIKEELAGKVVTGYAGGDMVVVEANCAQEIISIRIEKEIISADDSEMLEALVAGAVNDALRKSKEAAGEEMSKLTGGIRIPGLM